VTDVSHTDNKWGTLNASKVIFCHFWFEWQIAWSFHWKTVWTDVKFLDSSFFLNESEQTFSFPHTPINNLLQYLTITLITEIVTYCSHGDLFPDNVKFPDISLMVRGTPADVKCYSYHACTSVTVSGGGLGVGMQQCMIQNQYERHKLSKVETILKTGK